MGIDQRGGATTAPIQEEIDELRRKISLLEGDQKAYFESSESVIGKNKAIIAKMRVENKQLRAQLAKKLAGDEVVISNAFETAGKRQPPNFRGLSGRTAVSKFDQSLCEKIKSFNALQHEARQREKALTDLEIQFRQMVAEAEEVKSKDISESADAQQLRTLENQLDKTMIKFNEATHIRKTYEEIVEKMLEERLNFDNKIAALEREIKRRLNTVKELQGMYNDAQLAKDQTKEELGRQEMTMQEARKARERELNECKRQADEKKDYADRVERRLQHNSLQVDEPHFGTITEVGTLKSSEDDEHITTYQEAMAKIKEATGVSDIQEVVRRFMSQGETRKHLDQLKNDNEQLLVKLREEKEKLQAQFEDMKYSGEAKLSSGQKMLEDFEVHLKEMKEKLETTKAETDRSTKTLLSVKAGVEHLCEKLQNLKAPKSLAPKVPLDAESDELVLEMLATSEQKLVKLVEELEGRNLDEVMKEMEDLEFRSSVEKSLPVFNVRVKLPEVTEREETEEDSESGSDDDVLTRASLKQYAQGMIDARTKKRKGVPAGKKKKGKKD